MDYRAYGEYDICGIVDYCGGVARADAESRFAGGICCLDHSGTTGGKYYICLLHEEIRHIKARNIDPVDDAFGSAGFYRGIKNGLSGGYCTLLCSRVRADDYRVTGLEGDKALEYCR